MVNTHLDFKMSAESSNAKLITVSAELSHGIEINITIEIGEPV